MLSLRVLSQQGKPLASALSARFDKGGTIGRSPGCTLALPDPNRHISREQARIEAGPAGFTIHCTGSASAILINGQEIAPGESASLRFGDSLIVADYEIAVEDASAPGLPSAIGRDSGTIDDPFAALGLSQPSAPSVDPLGEFGLSPLAQSFTDPAPNTDRLGLSLLSTSARKDVALAASDSLDAMFDLAGASPDPLGAGSGLAGPASQPNTALSSDPMMSFGMNPQATASSLPDTTPEIAGTFRLPDEIPPTNFGFALGQGSGRGAAPVPEAAPPAQPVLPAPPKAAGAPADAFLSWQQPESSAAPAPAFPPAPVSGVGPTSLDTPPAQRAPTAVVADQIRVITDEIADRHQRDFAPPPRTRPTDFLNELNRAQVDALHAEIARSKAARAGPATTAQGPVSAAAAQRPDTLGPSAPVPEAVASESAFENSRLLEGLLLGLGLAELPRSPLAPRASAPALSPALMHRLGELVRVATQGTIDLLQARATLKREMKTEVTMIASRDNNPLKFSPDAQAAMAHLLSSQSIRGFLDPVPALQDSYDDLLAHQVGFVAGMRAAMAGLIGRFDPAVLESRLTRRSMLDSMMPSGRKARLWELFSELYSEISREAEDDFEALFGREFVKAYEQQIARLQRDQDNSSGSVG